MKPSKALPSGWRLARLGDVAEIILSNVDKKSNEDELPIRLCNYTDVYYNDYIDRNLPFMKGTATQLEIKRFSLKRGDVLITKDSETADDIAVPALVKEDLENVLCGYHLAILRPRNGELSGAYLNHLFGFHAVRHYLFTLANGVTRYGLTLDSIHGAVMPVPPIREQERLATILTTWNSAISQLAKLIEAKRKLKKGLMQQLLSDNQYTGSKNQWHKYRLGQVFYERKEINHADLPLLSVTGEQGLIPHSENGRKDSSAEDKSKYKRIVPGDIGYNTMRMWQGVSALSNLEGIISPAYTVCIPKENIYAPFARHLFKFPSMVHRFYRYSQGLVGDTLNLKFPSFAQVKVALPPIASQKKIAAVLDAIDIEIELLNKMVDKFKEQKLDLTQKALPMSR